MIDSNGLPSEQTPEPDTTQPTIEFLAKELARVSKERDGYRERLAEVIAKFSAYEKEVGTRDWQRVQAELAQVKADRDFKAGQLLSLQSRAAELEAAVSRMTASLQAIRHKAESQL